MSNLSIVTFHGQPVYAIEIDGKPYVAMKPICENIGLQWEAQQKRIRRNPVLTKGMSIMDLPSNGGVQQTICLPLDMLNGWLFGVDVNRVHPDIRDRLIKYQEECYSVLFKHFSTKSEDTAKPARPNTPLIAAEQAANIIEQSLRIGALFNAPLHLVQSEAVKQAYRQTGYNFDYLLKMAPAQIRIQYDDEMLEPTDLAQRLGMGKAGASVNKVLEAAGWQCRIDDKWVATDAGSSHCFRHHWTKGEKSGYNYKWRVSDVRELLSVT